MRQLDDSEEMPPMEDRIRLIDPDAIIRSCNRQCKTIDKQIWYLERSYSEILTVIEEIDSVIDEELTDEVGAYFALLIEMNRKRYQIKAEIDWRYRLREHFSGNHFVSDVVQFETSYDNDADSEANDEGVFTSDERRELLDPRNIEIVGSEGVSEHEDQDESDKGTNSQGPESEHKILWAANCKYLLGLFYLLSKANIPDKNISFIDQETYDNIGKYISGKFMMTSGNVIKNQTIRNAKSQYLRNPIQRKSVCKEIFKSLDDAMGDVEAASENWISSGKNDEN